MPSLRPAHLGYAYQDLLVACRLVDVMLGSLEDVCVDEPLVPADCFDDLTTIDEAGRRERVQIKHTDQVDQALTLRTFTTKARRLQLDHVISSVLADRGGPGSGAADCLFRIVLCDAPPTQSELQEVLAPAGPDPGPFVPGMDSERMAFHAEALWEKTKPQGTEKPNGSPFAFLRSCDSVDYLDVLWVCEHLVLELRAPQASFDLTNPGKAERLLLRRVRDEVGAGTYPNEHRTDVDVAAALVNCALQARSGLLKATKSELLRRADLRVDYGAVARRDPVDAAVEVPRPSAVTQVLQRVSRAADEGRPLVLLGAPGQGKSWTCKQVVAALSDDDWLVADHYCYLGNADAELRPRVQTASVFGSLIARLGELDPQILADQRPRFAASENALEDVVATATAKRASSRVALVIDGLDHVSRVIGPGSIDPSFALAQAIASLHLPTGSAVVVSSQPGTYLEPLQAAGAITFEIPDLDEEELAQLAGRLGAFDGQGQAAHRSLDFCLQSATPQESRFLTTLTELSGGNALYATYLCREATRNQATLAAPEEALVGLPPYNGSLRSYYQHVRSSLGEQGHWVADVLALAGFPLSRSDLREIWPELSHRVEKAVGGLQPVLQDRATQAGLVIYHESFSRFLQEALVDHETAKVSQINRIANWLEGKGLFKETRAFRHLPRLLSATGRHKSVLGLIGEDFVLQSIAHGFPSSAIIANLSVAIQSASATNDWPAVARYVEMSRSAETYQEERFATAMVGFADVVAALLGAPVLADRLLHEGRPTMSARLGLQMCAALDGLGAIPPWPEYIRAFLRESKDDNDVIYDEASDRSVAAALMRGRLRLASFTEAPSVTTASGSGVSNISGDYQLADPAAFVDWSRLIQNVDEGHYSPTEVVDVILDTFGYRAVVGLLGKLAQPGAFYLALGEAVLRGTVPDPPDSPPYWAERAAHSGLPAGHVWRALALGVNIEALAPATIEDDRERLLSLTTEVQGTLPDRECEFLDEWLDRCTVAARRDHFGLATAEALLKEPGWYTCWLRFVVALAFAECKPPNEQSPESLKALRVLTEVDSPFLGDPRACDLYPIHDRILATIERAVLLIDDESRHEAFRMLDAASSAISVTISGELGGPLPRDSLLRLAVETATSADDAADLLLREAIDTGGGGRYYEDLATFRLLAARRALNIGSETEAWHHWQESCRLLTAYGFHKDTTIFELLEPIPSLLPADPSQGRLAVAKLQPLCKRVTQHTDGKETRHASTHWWRLLAAADPCALSRRVLDAALSSCNDPNWLLHEARAALWRAWYRQADPIVASALRLTLDVPLDMADPEAFGLVARATDECGSASLHQVLVSLVARADERPFTHGATNDEELLANDQELVEAINAVAVKAGAPRIGGHVDSPVEAGRPKPLGSRLESTLPAGTSSPAARSFEPGPVGLSQASHAWRYRPYNATGPEWSLDRFTNIIGYRLGELIQTSSPEDVEIQLKSVADRLGLDDRLSLLRALAEGFERLAQPRLAATAYTLAWTRARGYGWWGVFGGVTEIESLRRAVEIDEHGALRALANEVERLVSHGLGTLGVTRSLVYACLHDCLGVSREVAFGVWTEAFKVIEGRAPRVAASDDPTDVYSAPEPDPGTDLVGDLNVAFAGATLAGLAHPGREQKRRSLLAAEELIARRASMTAPAFAATVASLSDPATLTWLLRVIELGGENSTPIISEAHEALLELAQGPHLTTRVLARRLLRNDDLPAAPPTKPDPELVRRSHAGVVFPAGAGINEHDSRPRDFMVERVAGRRLSPSERVCPGLREAVHRRVAETRQTEVYRRRIGAQRSAYADEFKERSPDIFSAFHEAVEDAIQRGAAGVRGARIMNGQSVVDPLQLEEHLAQSLLDDLGLPLALERTRQPRPELPSPPPRDSLVWAGFESDETQRNTLEVLPAEAMVELAGGPFDGWRLLASLERRWLPRGDWKDKEYDIARRFRIGELRVPGDQEGLSSPPITQELDWTWGSSIPAGSSSQEPTASRSFVGSDIDVHAAGDAHEGLGVEVELLTPSQWLLNVSQARRCTDFVVEDADGPVLALVTWRTEYETSDYHLAWPRLRGSGLAIRRDVFNRLAQTAKGLVLRDFVSGTGGFFS
jgi:hypothetical protein